jgi:hypothetical protein
VNTERFTQMAHDLSAEGDHFAASVLCFLCVLHMKGDRPRLKRLSAFAGTLSAEAQSPPDRMSQEKIAIEGLTREL